MSKTPTLDALVASGTVWFENHEYFGRAADGVVVCFGAIFVPKDKLSVESYLVEHPTPDTW